MRIAIKKKHYTQSEMMFLFLWTFYSLYYFLLSASEIYYDYYSFASSLRRYCSYALILLLFAFWIVEFCRGVDLRLNTFLIYIGFLFVILLIEINNRDSTLLILALFIMAAQFIDFEKLLRYDIKLKLVILVVIFSLCALGIVENRVGDYYSGYKMAFGFGHPNTMVCYVTTILIEWLCIRYKKMKWYDWFGILLVFIVLSFVSASRTSIYTFAVIYILFVIANFIPKVFSSKIVKALFLAITPVMAAISFWAIRLYGEGNSFIQEINTWMSGRIRLAYCAVEVKGIPLFGQEIQFSSRFNRVNNRTIFLVDNAYIHMALQWGMIILLLMILAYCILFIKLINMGEINLALMSLFFVVLGIGETYMNSVLYNLSILCLLGTSIKQKGMPSKSKVEIT